MILPTLPAPVGALAGVGGMAHYQTVLTEILGLNVAQTLCHSVYHCKNCLVKITKSGDICGRT